MGQPMDHAADDSSTHPFVSVIVPTADRPAVLADCLESLAAQDYPSYEVVVVDNGSLPAPSFAGARRVRIDRRDANAARNAGIAASTGDPVCFVDDDVVAPPGWLSGLVGGLARHPDADCAGGGIRSRFETAPPRTCSEHELAGLSLERGPEDSEATEVWGGNMVIRRSALDSVGPFREGLRCHQEWEWQRRYVRAGGRLVYVSDAWLWHRRGRSQLRVSRLLREFFLRGWTKASLGFAVDLRRTGRLAVENLRHGLEARCVRGFEEAARDAGLLCATLLRR